MAARAHYEVLDGLRGTAALAVVVFHFGEMLYGSPARNPMHHANLAVDFFFALSGYVLGCAYDGRLAKDAPAKFKLSFAGFSLRRIIRLQPALMFGVTVGLISYLFDPFVGEAQRVGQAVPLGSLLLIFALGLFALPAPVLANTFGENHPLNAPAWSLFWEYVASFAYGYFGPKIGRVGLGILCFISAVGLIITGVQLDNLGYGWDYETFWVGGVRLAFPFTMGLLLYRLKLRIKIPQTFLVLSALLIAIFMLPTFGAYNGAVETGMVILIFPLMLMAGAGIESEKGWVGRLCRYFGALSYPIYAFHYAIVYMFYHWIRATHPDRPLRFMVAGGLIVLIVGLSTLILYAFDQPVRAWLTKKLTKPAPARALAPAE